MSVIRCDNLTKSYNPGLGRKRVDALSGLTMSVSEREVFGFLGPNGAGKTTAIKILTGLIFPTSGSAFLFDRPAGDREAKQRLGFLPEHPYFYDHLTGREMVEYAGQLFGLTRADARSRATRLLERVGLAHAADQVMRGYSKGMLQRVGIAQALVNDPPLVILDEPMSGLDPVGRKEVRDIILEMRTEKRTVFFSTHILSDVEVVCDRIAILHRGKLVTLEPLQELLRLAGTGVEVVVIGLSAAGRELLSKLPGTALSDSGDRLVVRTAQEQTGAVLDIARTNAGNVLSMVPLRRTLEEIFMSTIGDGPTPP